MPSTYTPIATTTLSSDAGSVTFSSISGSYTDLILVCTPISTGTAQPDVLMQVNSDTGSNYSRTRLVGNGSSATSSRFSNQTEWVIGPMESTQIVNMICQIQNYSNTTTNKTMLVRSNDTSIATQAMVCLWRSTSAITSIYLFPEPAKGNFKTGSTFTLYGVKSA